MSEITLLGLPEVPIYLKQVADEWMLIEGGVAPMSARVLRQLQEVVGDLSKVRYWVITHSHYDHVGMLPSLLPFLPNVTVYGVQAVADAFQSERAIGVICMLNDDLPARGVEKCLADEVVPLPAMVNYRDIQVNVISEDAPLALPGGHCLKVIPTPGHSRCSTSFLLAPEGVLFVADSLGEMITPERWLPLVFDNAQQYEQSLKKISDLKVNALAMGHHGMLVGNEVGEAIAGAVNSFYAMRSYYEKGVANGEPLNQMIEDVCAKYGDKYSAFISPKLLRASIKRMFSLFNPLEKRE